MLLHVPDRVVHHAQSSSYSHRDFCDSLSVNASSDTEKKQTRTNHVAPPRPTILDYKSDGIEDNVVWVRWEEGRARYRRMKASRERCFFFTPLTIYYVVKKVYGIQR